MTWTAAKPANIALIKYMGKSADNVPLNPSLSFTLDAFTTTVEIERIEGKTDEWDQSVPLSERDQAKFLKHLSFLKETFGETAAFRVRSRNNFPAHCGLASSASSFAALTACAAKAISELQGRGLENPDTLNALSRRGSGSSCRSFYAPFAVWDRTGCRPIDLGMKTLRHQVVVVDASQKEVSSSEAHKRVLTSGLWEGRVTRAEARYQAVIEGLRGGRWAEVHELVWAEFWDMHALFETSCPPFGYMSPQSLEVQKRVRALWKQTGDGPLVTMDAGANVHLLYREDQRELCLKFRRDALREFKVLGEGERV
ncbi:MAG TPA: diphosphomevalonate decarboxylase [Bdellovibrionales bacterium]|nr:diphosphomevalonate decarboxylase [Bdellovibrionales bacterium]